MWNKVPGMEVQHRHSAGRHSAQYLINGERVSESAWKRRYVAALEAELDELHGKLAKIYELI